MTRGLATLAANSVTEENHAPRMPSRAQKLPGHRVDDFPTKHAWTIAGCGHDLNGPGLCLVRADGTTQRRYHTSRVVCEVLDPGGYPPLSEPTELRHVLQSSLPDAPPPDYPSGKKGYDHRVGQTLSEWGCILLAFNADGLENICVRSRLPAMDWRMLFRSDPTRPQSRLRFMIASCKPCVLPVDETAK